MKKNLSRRDFIKLSGLALGGLAFQSPFPRPGEGDYGNITRVTIRDIDVRAEPRDGAQIVGKRLRDQLVEIYYDLEPPDAPAFYNKLWYRVWGGYLHSTYLQPVEIRFNEPLQEIRQGGQLCEVSVPYTQSYRFSRYDGWLLEYRLYYETTHWVTGIDEGPEPPRGTERWRVVRAAVPDILQVVRSPVSRQHRSSSGPATDCCVLVLPTA